MSAYLSTSGSGNGSRAELDSVSVKADFAKPKRDNSQEGTPKQAGDNQYCVVGDEELFMVAIPEACAIIES